MQKFQKNLQEQVFDKFEMGENNFVVTASDDMPKEYLIANIHIYGAKLTSLNNTQFLATKCVNFSDEEIISCLKPELLDGYELISINQVANKALLKDVDGELVVFAYTCHQPEKLGIKNYYFKGNTTNPMHFKIFQ